MEMSISTLLDDGFLVGEMRKMNQMISKLPPDLKTVLSLNAVFPKVAEEALPQSEGWFSKRWQKKTRGVFRERGLKTEGKKFNPIRDLLQNKGVGGLTKCSGSVYKLPFHPCYVCS